jgi:hypothetical protein
MSRGHQQHDDQDRGDPQHRPDGEGGAVCVARRESSISTAAMIGMGLIATPSAAGSRSPREASVLHIAPRG